MVQLQQAAARRGSKLHRSNHVAALVSSKDAAALAEELLHKQEHNLELQQQLKCVLTEKRNLEVELSSSRNALIRAMQHSGPIQQQLQQQGSCAADDECAVMSFHQQCCLLGTRQEQDAALQETQQQVAYEQALTRHLYCVLEQVRAAAEAAAASDDSSTGGRLSQELLTILAAFQFPAVAPCALRTPVSSLAVAQEAHKVLLQQALLLRGKLAVPAPGHTVGPASIPALSGCPAGPRPMSASSGRTTHTSGGSSQARKAQELLAFMQSHVQRLQDLLHSLAGPLAASSPHIPPWLQPQQAEQQCQQPLGPGSQDPHPEFVLTVPARPGAAVSGRASRGFCPAARPQTASVRSVSCSGSARPLSAAAGSSRTPCWTKCQSSGLSAVPEGPSMSRPASKQPASMPDLTPYLTFPPRRPGSPNALAAHRACPRQAATQNAAGISSGGAAAAAEATQLVQELQEALTDRELLIQLLQQQQDQLQGQLQAAGEDLAALQQQLDMSQQAVGALQTQAAASAEANTILQGELHAAQQAAALVQQALQQQQQQQQELQQELQRLQEAQAGSHAEVEAQEVTTQQALLAEQEASAAAAAAAHNSQVLALQQQLLDAQVQVQELQQQLHQQQVQHIQAEQVWTQQLDAATATAAAAAAAATSLPVVPSAVEEPSASSKRAQLLQLAQWLADDVAGMQPAQAVLTETGDLQDNLVPLCGALQQLVHGLKQVVQEQLSCSTLPQAARSTGSTAQLEGHLEETATEVQQCMDMLQEVVASARRASEMGLPGLQYASIKRFSQLDTEWQALPAAGERVSSGRLSE